MPIYLYRCPTCKHEIEMIRPVNSAGTPECTECSRVGLEVEMEKVPTVAAFVVNGHSAKNGYSK